MKVIKAGNQECELKTYEDKKLRSQKTGLFNEKLIKEKLMKKTYNYMVWL